MQHWIWEIQPYIRNDISFRGSSHLWYMYKRRLKSIHLNSVNFSQNIPENQFFYFVTKILYFRLLTVCKYSGQFLLHSELLLVEPQFLFLQSLVFGFTLLCKVEPNGLSCYSEIFLIEKEKFFRFENCSSSIIPVGLLISFISVILKVGFSPFPLDS